MFSGPDQEQWKQSIKNEIDNFLNQKAWVKVPMTTVQQEENIPVGTKTVLKIKNEHDGSLRYKTRIVTQGYSMIPGKDYQESFSPVEADMSIKAMLAMSLFIINFGKWMPLRAKQMEFERRYNLPACDD